MLEELQEILEMMESDLEMTKKIGGVYDQKPKGFCSHNEILQGYVDDLKETLEKYSNTI